MPTPFDLIKNFYVVIQYNLLSDGKLLTMITHFAKNYSPVPVNGKYVNHHLQNRQF